MTQIQTWSQRKFWLLIVGVFLFGMILSPKGTDTQVASSVDTKPQVQTVEVVKEVKVADRAALEQLDAIDQEIFGLSVEVIDAQSTALEVAGAIVGNLDSVTIADMETATEMIGEQTELIKSATQKVEQKQAERNALLK